MTRRDLLALPLAALAAALRPAPLAAPLDVTPFLTANDSVDLFALPPLRGRHFDTIWLDDIAEPITSNTAVNVAEWYTRLADAAAAAKPGAKILMAPDGGGWQVTNQDTP